VGILVVYAWKPGLFNWVHNVGFAPGVFDRAFLSFATDSRLSAHGGFNPSRIF
jgi:hypothetical protein